jgi:Tfp pilus assembly protein PilF
MLNSHLKKLRTALLIIALLLPLCAHAQSQPSPAQQNATAAASATSDPSVERGVKLFQQGDMKGAAKEFRAAVKRTKNDPEAWFYLGQALLSYGDLKEARKALDAALGLKPDFAQAHASFPLACYSLQCRRPSKRFPRLSVCRFQCADDR